ncbi:MAG: superoxide dismutase [Clostridiales bacterium]|nr:superoxide dismutase [Clostridiales bacterium]
MSYDRYKFILKPLKYGYNAYLPSLNTETMQLHHSVHLQRYIDCLNIELDGYPKLQPLSIERIPAAARRLSNDNYKQLIHYVGGVYCHNTYFDLLVPPGIMQACPSDSLKDAIINGFGSFESFFYAFKQAALNHKVSGWLWLLADSRGRLSIEATKENDLPNLYSKTAILVLDMWEHAYYLTYRYNKSAYIDGFFRIINWKTASENYEKFKINLTR